MIDREIQRKLKDCSFIVLQGKLLSALLDTGPKQMSFFFFFPKQHPHYKDNLREFQIHQKCPRNMLQHLYNNQELSFACFYK